MKVKTQNEISIFKKINGFGPGDPTDFDLCLDKIELTYSGGADRRKFSLSFVTAHGGACANMFNEGDQVRIVLRKWLNHYNDDGIPVYSECSDSQTMLRGKLVKASSEKKGRKDREYYIYSGTVEGDA